MAKEKKAKQDKVDNGKQRRAIRKSCYLCKVTSLDESGEPEGFEIYSQEKDPKAARQLAIDTGFDDQLFAVVTVHGKPFKLMPPPKVQKLRIVEQ